MEEIYTVSFFGHRRVEQTVKVEEQIEEVIWQILKTNTFVNFLVGRNGEFDQLVSSTIRRIQKVQENCFHTLILPYSTAEYHNNAENFHDYYDQVEICDDKVYPKAAIQKRNREMVERSDFVVFYVTREHGGAYQTYQYARKQQKKILLIK